MRGVTGLAWVAAVASALMAAEPGRAQTTESVFGPADTVSVLSSHTPITYDTSYDRNVSSGTWTQTLSYGITRPRVILSANGNYTAVDFGRSQGLGGENGTFTGQLDMRPAKRWNLDLNGNFNHVASHDQFAETTQRQNRLKLSSGYSINPFRVLLVSAAASTEFQQDNGLAIRPLGQDRVRLLPRYNAAGDSVGVDSIFVHDQRDSTFMSGRQDGLNAQIDWKPKRWLQWTSSATGTRVNQKTTTYLRDFGRTVGGAPIEIPEQITFRSPNENEAYQTKATYLGSRGMLAWVNLRSLQNVQGYYEKSLRKEEKLSVRQRGGLAHMEYSPIRGGQVTLDGRMESIFSQYGQRTSRTSYVLSRVVNSSFSFVPSSRARAGIDFSLESRSNERQESGNGKTISRFAQANGAYRVSSRLGLDAAGTISLLSSQYVQAALDQDNVRGYVNVGGVYVVSERCSTFVHFSSAQSHAVAIDPSRSGNNNVQTSYQMDATLKLGLNSRVFILQNYLLNAIYQIYDDERADARNVLSRIRRIDTTVSDSLFPLVTVQLVHSFLFRDSGSYTRPLGGGNRLYHVGSQTYQQTLGVTTNMRPLDGVQLFVTQSLGNSKVDFPSTATRVIDNRWNLAVGATVNRALGGTASLQGTVQHISAYTEQRNPGDPLNEQDDWLAGVTFHKDF